MSDYTAGLSDQCNADDDVSCVLSCAPLTLFRQAFPVFANSLRYPDMQVEFYLDLGRIMINWRRWGRMAWHGSFLVAAHFLALAQQAASNPRGIPGTVIGVLNSGSVDKVSYGRDVASVMEENAGHWGMTTFGLQWLRFARIFGAGPVQVGIGGGLVTDPAYYLPQSAIAYTVGQGFNYGPVCDPNLSASDTANSDQAWPGVLSQNSPTYP
jgi:hypothetical protein